MQAQTPFLRHFPRTPSLLREDQGQCPLILVGGLRSPGVVERLCKERTADFFSMARPLVSEPDLVGRWKSGDSRVARCISCNKCLFTMLQGGVARCYQFGGKA